MLPIDLVYTWVDGDDAAHRRLAERYAGRASDLNPERTRDAYELLRYSLRSVERYAPWVRHVYVVTSRPQAPAWLDRAHPGLSLVHHDEIFDDPRYLPSFSCHAIESYLHRIPGLADHFLYLNDDYLFGRAVTPEDFLDADGRVLVYGTLVGEPIPFVRDDLRNDLVSRFQHVPLLIYRPWYEAMLARWSADVARTRARRFRRRDDVTMHGLYRWYALTRQRRHARAVPVFRYRRDYRFHKLTNDLAKQRAGLARLRAQRPKFYCLNDDQGAHPDAAVSALVRAFLDESYPAPSSYERRP